MRSTLNRALALLAAGTLFLCAPAFAQSQAPTRFDLPAQPLADALKAVGARANINVLISPELVDGRRAPALNATLTLDQAIAELLKGTGITFKYLSDKTITLIAATAPAKVTTAAPVADLRLVEAAQTVEQQVPTAPESGSANIRGIPELLVNGRRSLNTDMERTEDDPQPYVVFSAEDIQRSQAINLEDFLRARLPMNTAYDRNTGQTTGSALTMSNINLRGLGQNQTLILVDGRRLPQISATGMPLQADINGIPLSAIERVEVLPSTAGGIYGGSATGGVINIVMRRNFRGMEVRGTYLNTFDTDAGNRRADLNAGFGLEGGRTQVMLAGSYSDANTLAIGDRDFSSRAIALQLENDPAAITGLDTPPLGGTANIRGVDGALLTLKPQYGNTALGSAFTSLPPGYAGAASDGGAALLANAGRYNTDLPGGMLGRDRGLMAASSMESASLNARREFGRHLEAFVDLSSNGNRGVSFGAVVPNDVTLPANAPNNPFNEDIVVSFPTPGLTVQTSFKSTTRRITGGLIGRLPHNWTAGLDYGWGRSRLVFVQPQVSLDAVGSCVLASGVAAGVDPDGAGPLVPCAPGDLRPALNVMRDANTFPLDFSPYLSTTAQASPYDTTLRNATLRLSGPVMELPGGALTLSALAERREERIEDAFQSAGALTIMFPHRSQDTNGYYLELRAPVMRKLELQVSGRRDEYRTMSDRRTLLILFTPDAVPSPPLTFVTNRVEANNYTTALRYSPFESLALRASYGTGFLPPSMMQVAPSSATSPSSLGITDPKRGGNALTPPFTWLFGGSPGLRPEESRSFSLGMIFTPALVPGLRVSVDYTRIEKADEIQTPDLQFLLDHEDEFPGRIARSTLTAEDAALGYTGGRVTSVDQGYLNIANTKVEAWDVQVDYTVETARFGRFHGYTIGTWAPHYLNRLRPGDPIVDSAGYTQGPLKLRGNLGLDWNKGPLTVGWNAQYYDSYLAYTALALPLTPAQEADRAATVLGQGSNTIPGQIYHDLVATWRFDSGSFGGRFLAGGEFSVGIQNLFDHSPPILAAQYPGSAGYSLYGDPRLRRYSLSLRKSFQ